MVASIASRAVRLGRAGRFDAERVRLLVGSLFLYIPVAIITRMLLLGKPAFHPDEQFYLLVGQRMSQGALPYVDLWDRKPWGLFEIYRSVFLLPFDPVWTYQALGLLFSVLTALVIERIGRKIAPLRAARLAGAAYLLWGPVFNIALGQSPAFYNLPVALAALIVVESVTRARDPQLAMRGLAAMLLLGLAMQIKYSAIFEGVGLGLMLLYRGRADGWPVLRLIATGTMWVCAALAPTALVTLFYVLRGDGETFFYANFLSVFTRSTGIVRSLQHLRDDLLMLIPYFLAILVAPRHLSRPRGENPAALPGIRLWAAASFFGFLIFGTWYDHYVGPMLVPFSVLAAPALAREAKAERWYGRILLIGGAIGTFIATNYQVRQTGTAQQLESAAQAISANLHGRCLYVFEGDSALYRLTNSCLPTRYVFPSHLSLSKEAGALGIDLPAEVQRIMDARPGVIMTDVKYGRNKVNAATYALMRSELHAHYERYDVVELGRRHYRLWRLRDGQPG